MDKPLTFVCRVPKGELKKLKGNLRFETVTFPTQFEATKMDNLQGVEPFRDTPVPKGDFKQLQAAVTKQADDLEVFEIAEVLVKAADEGKVSLAQLREALEPALKAAQEYGDPWRQEFTLLLAQRLSGREAYAGFGEEMAREALKLAGAGASADLQL